MQHGSAVVRPALPGLLLAVFVGMAHAGGLPGNAVAGDGDGETVSLSAGDSGAGQSDPATSDQQMMGTIHLQPGRTKRLHYDNVSHVAVGDGNLIEAKPLKAAGDIVVIGEHKGETDLRVWVNNKPVAYYKVFVEAPETSINPEQLREILGETDNLRIAEVNGTVNVVGRATDAIQYRRVQALTKRFDDVFAYVKKPEVETDKKTVFIKARFLEVSNNAVKDLGVNWSDQISGPVFASASDFETNNLYRPGYDDINGSSGFPLDIGRGNNFFGLGFKLTSTINFMVQNGYARQIAEPTLSARSGESASFNSGGKIPIPFETSEGGQQAQFEDYGIKLDVSPVVADDGKTIRSDVRVEVSDVDPTIRIQGIPGLTQRRAKTVMTAPSGRSLVIAGLVDRDDSKTVSKVPLLGDIPILGELFKSRNFRNDDTQLVIVMTPYVGGQASRVNQALLNRQGQLSEKADKAVRFRLLD